MPVVNVGIVRMTVAQFFVSMHMAMGLREQGRIVVMPMVFVMSVAMVVFRRFMDVLVVMTLGQM